MRIVIFAFLDFRSLLTKRPLSPTMQKNCNFPEEDRS